MREGAYGVITCSPTADETSRRSTRPIWPIGCGRPLKRSTRSSTRRPYDSTSFRSHARSFSMTFGRMCQVADSLNLDGVRGIGSNVPDGDAVVVRYGRHPQHCTTGLLPRVCDGKPSVWLAVSGPSPVSHFPGTASGVCFDLPNSPWLRPFPPAAPQSLSLPCSPLSQVVRPHPTSSSRAS